MKMIINHWSFVKKETRDVISLSGRGEIARGGRKTGEELQKRRGTRFYLRDAHFSRGYPHFLVMP